MWRSIVISTSGSVLAIALIGCSKPSAPAKASPTYTLRQVELPNVSRSAPSVQQQLRDGYAALKKKIDAPATPPEELGTAYGQMGMLLMAAEYREQAESELLNAETYHTRDPRWPETDPGQKSDRYRSAIVH